MTDAHPDQPEVFEAHWDRDQVDALFADLQRVANISHIQVRTTSGDRRSETVVSLEQAYELLDDARTKAIQIYYEYDDATWCDTLLLSDTIRIIRTSVPAAR